MQFGDTALHYAVYCGHIDIVKILLATPTAGWDTLSSDGRSALALAMASGQDGIAQLLMARSSKVGGDGTDTSAVSALPANNNYFISAASLADASLTGDLRSVYRLLVTGADPNGCDVDGYSPLHRAAAGGHHLIVGLLLERGADPNARDPVRLPATSILFAANSSVVLVLMSCHSRVRRHGTCLQAGCTPLHFSALVGSTECCHALLSDGADHTRRSREGVTPLDVARAENKLAVVRQLMHVNRHVEPIDLSWGVVLEGPLQVKRSKGLALFKWRQQHAAISQPRCELCLWSGAIDRVETPVTALRLHKVQSITHEAKSRRFCVRPEAGDAWEFSAASPEDAALWVATIRAVATQSLETGSRVAQTREVMALEASSLPTEATLVAAEVPSPEPTVVQVVALPQARPSPTGAANPTATPSSVQGDAATLLTAPIPHTSTSCQVLSHEPLSATSGTNAATGSAAATRPGRLWTAEERAALTLQRVARGHQTRLKLRGWTRVIADDGDIYWYNVESKQSSWFPPASGEADDEGDDNE